MGAIERMLEVAAARREASDLGGMITFPGCEPMPCAMGFDVSGLQSADNSAGFQFNQTRRVVVRSELLAGLPRQPQAGDEVILQGNLEAAPSVLVISPTSGIEQFNAILTAFNLYNPNA
jgi:hypothetical protein